MWVARLFGFDPKVAFLSHSTFGKPISKNTKHVRDAIELLKEEVDFDFDGEMRPDVALNPIYQDIYPFQRYWECKYFDNACFTQRRYINC